MKSKLLKQIGRLVDRLTFQTKIRRHYCCSRFEQNNGKNFNRVSRRFALTSSSMQCSSCVENIVEKWNIMMIWDLPFIVSNVIVHHDDNMIRRHPVLYKYLISVAHVCLEVDAMKTLVLKYYFTFLADFFPAIHLFML